MEKPFILSDALIAQLDSVDTSTLGDEWPTFTRKCYHIKAHVGVNAEDILSEVQEIEDEIERGEGSIPPVNYSQRILTTTLTEYREAVTALSYKGFHAVAEGFRDMMEGSLRRERYEALAADIIRNRDER